jgi:hypothetical protein
MMKIVMFLIVMFVGMGAAYADGIDDCKKVTRIEECNKTAPKVTFSGKKKLEKPIRVVVCHPYWDRLNVGTLSGRKTKWWGPTIGRGKWSANLPAADSACKTFWVKPGSTISTKASCVQRVISTKKMLTPGTYTME